MKITLYTVLFFLGLSFNAFSQSRSAGNIEDLSWLAGHWKGEAFGGVAEEFWSQANDKVMMGMFRLFSDGKLAFSEFEQIDGRDTLMFLVKHFNPDFKGWEDKDKFIHFKFRSGNRNETNFYGLSLIRIDENTCKHVILLRDKETGEAKEEEIIYQRIK